jgi:FAD:protein FMN transferase
MAQEPILYHNSCFLMGTRLAVVILDKPQSFAESVYHRIVEETIRLELKLSRFSEGSDVYRINQSAAQRPVDVDDEMMQVLLLCIGYDRLTDGAFDVTLPSRCSGPQSCHGLSMSTSVFPDPHRQQVRFSNPHVKLDLGGFGKGYALQKIRQILGDCGIENALVSFGESSILACGTHPYGDCWKIGISHVYEPAQSSHVFDLTNQSLSVSGFRRDASGGWDYHIFSPAAAMPVARQTTVAVQSPDCLEAEVLSTALTAALDTQASFLNRFDNCRAIRIDYNEDRSAKVHEYDAQRI